MWSFLSSLVFIMATAVLMSGCMQMSSRYVKGTEYDRALMMYESGRLADARYKARSIPKDDPSYRAARKLLEDINAISMQLSRRHLEMAEDYERAGIRSKAVWEYSKALEYNPSSILARQRMEVLTDAMRAGDAPEPQEKKAQAPPPPKKSWKEEPEDLANLHYLKGKVYLESRAYARAIEEFTLSVRIVPSYMNAKELLERSKTERDKAVDKHLRKGIAHFQSEEMELAIKEWDTVLELDPSNRVAADYKNRAEVIMERLQRIRENQASSDKSSL